MKRWLLPVSAALSLVMAIIVLVLACRSLWVQEILDRQQSRYEPDGSSWSSTTGVSVVRGRFYWRRELHSSTAAENQLMMSSPMLRLGPPIGPEPPVDRWVHESTPAQWSGSEKSLANHLGFGADRVTYPSTGNPPGVTITVDYGWVQWWYVAGALLILPILALRRWHRTRHRAGHCPACGYDLRATPDRCPECGTVPTADRVSSPA